VAPSRSQIRQRKLFGAAALAWSTLSPQTRSDWLAAARAAHLYLTGYTLFIWWTLTPDREAMRTIERISGIHLVN